MQFHREKQKKIRVDELVLTTSLPQYGIEEGFYDEKPQPYENWLLPGYILPFPASRPMIDRKHGRIINIASVAGIMPLRLQCAFVAAKAGVVNLTKAMAIELAPSGILVNGIAPGSVLTEGTKKLLYGNDAKFQESMKNMLSHVPLGRPANTEEIAHAALFLAAPETSYITGHVLVVDGGWTAGYIRDF